MNCTICGGEMGSGGCWTAWKHPNYFTVAPGYAGPAIDTGAIHRAPLVAELARLRQAGSALALELKRAINLSLARARDLDEQGAHGPAADYRDEVEEWRAALESWRAAEKETSNG
jgi:hypothetical protein